MAWAVGLKYTAGFTRLWPSAFTLATMAGSVGTVSYTHPEPTRQAEISFAVFCW